MNEYNKITITECNKTTYTESVGWSFDEAVQMLLGKEGKNGSLIYSVSMEDPSLSVQGVNCACAHTAIYSGD